MIRGIVFVSFLFLVGRAAGEPPEKLATYYQPKRCGPIALYAICRWHHVETTLEELVELSGSGRHGTSLAGLIQAATAKGLEGKAYASSSKHLMRITTPAIVDYPVGHFSLLLKVTSDQVTIFDPPKKIEAISMEEFSKQWGGNVIVFSVAPKK